MSLNPSTESRDEPPPMMAQAATQFKIVTVRPASTVFRIAMI